MLSWISSDFFARSPMLAYPVIALCIFMLVFTVASLHAWLRDPRVLDRMARMPLEGDSADDQEVDHG